nr:hypothetical protein [Tanacetum cinerariifolium]
MAAIRYRDEHNKVGYLLKPTGSDDYHQIIDFLRASHIRYALTHNPIIFYSLVKQFWSTATLMCLELGPPAIQATIDETPYTINDDLVRSQLQLADAGGIDDLPVAEIFSGMDNLEYVTEGKLTFFKNKFSPQWRFLVHIILQCLSTKSGIWDQFGSPLAVALICLSEKQIDLHCDQQPAQNLNPTFTSLMDVLRYRDEHNKPTGSDDYHQIIDFLRASHLRFLQAILDLETRIKRQYKVLMFSSKLFANMRLNFEGNPMQLLPAMLLQAPAGEGVRVAAHAGPQYMPALDQPQDHLS